ncbi:MAG: Crp/Fnr family transcriptional regulator [Bacillota bacterium]
MTGAGSIKGQGGPVFRERVLREYEREFLRDIGRRVEYKKGRILFRAGESAGKIFLVENGQVGVGRISGDELNMSVERLRRPGELVGLCAFFCSDRSCDAQALSDVTVLSVDRDDFQELLNSDPFFLKSIMSILHERAESCGSAEDGIGYAEKSCTGARKFSRDNCQTDDR